MCSTSSRPAKNEALNVVVAICETPPPRSSLKMPFWITKPVVKPFSSVRSPTVPLSENVSPGLSTVPLISSAARPMFWSRYDAGG